MLGNEDGFQSGRESRSQPLHTDIAGDVSVEIGILKAQSPKPLWNGNPGMIAYDKERRGSCGVDDPDRWAIIDPQQFSFDWWSHVQRRSRCPC